MITLRAGPTPATPPQAIALTPITVFVGPNNSGKSKLLAELGQFCSSGTQNQAALLLAKASLIPFSEAEVKGILEVMRAPISPNEVLTPGNIILKSRNRYQVSLADFTTALLPGRPHSRLMITTDEPSRLSLINSDSVSSMLIGDNALEGMVSPAHKSLSSQGCYVRPYRRRNSLLLPELIQGLLRIRIPVSLGQRP